MSDWKDTPPTQPARYWLKRRIDGYEFIGRLTVGQFWHDDLHGVILCCERGDDAAKRFQFGQEIPSNDELSELPGLIDGLKALLLSTSAPLCLDARREELCAITGKINAILGVS